MHTRAYLQSFTFAIIQVRRSSLDYPGHGDANFGIDARTVLRAAGASHDGDDEDTYDKQTEQQQKKSGKRRPTLSNEDLITVFMTKLNGGGDTLEGYAASVASEEAASLASSSSHTRRRHSYNVGDGSSSSYASSSIRIRQSSISHNDDELREEEDYELSLRRRESDSSHNTFRQSNTIQHHSSKGHTSYNRSNTSPPRSMMDWSPTPMHFDQCVEIHYTPQSSSSNMMSSSRQQFVQSFSSQDTPASSYIMNIDPRECQEYNQPMATSFSTLNSSLNTHEHNNPVAISYSTLDSSITTLDCSGRSNYDLIGAMEMSERSQVGFMAQSVEQQTSPITQQLASKSMETNRSRGLLLSAFKFYPENYPVQARRKSTGTGQCTSHANHDSSNDSTYYRRSSTSSATRRMNESKKKKKGILENPFKFLSSTKNESKSDQYQFDESEVKAELDRIARETAAAEEELKRGPPPDFHHMPSTFK